MQYSFEAVISTYGNEVNAWFEENNLIIIIIITLDDIVGFFAYSMACHYHMLINMLHKVKFSGKKIVV